MTIEPTEFDLVALARRGLQALLDEADAEVEFARRFAMVDVATRSLTPASAEAKAKARDAYKAAKDRLARFDMLHPEPVAA